jgi:hypothetical protein
MDRPTYTFKIGQQVSYDAGGRNHGKRTGPYTIVGIVRQSGGGILYRIKSRTHEHLAFAEELKLVLPKAKLSPE